MVSIIVPCYNGEKFIKRCFESILNQTYNDIELIVVNDGSKDGSEETILSYKNNFLEKNIKLVYVYKENGGLGSAINKGLKYVTGKYITLLDIDDYIMPQSIELKVNFLEENLDYDIVRTNGYYVTENNLDDESKLFVTEKEEKEEIYIFDDLIRGKVNNWAGSYMVRSDKLFAFYKDRNIYESRYGQNLQILLPLAYKGRSGFIDKPLMKYIRQEKSLSQLEGDTNKEIKNLLGYKEIRCHMVNLIMNGKEKEQYIKLIETMYARYIMDIAFSKKDILLMDEYYNVLKSYKCLTIDDKILYYGLKNKFIQCILRVYRKIFFRR